jgi:hypothetical protein
MKPTEEKLMNSPTIEEATEKSTVADTEEVRDLNLVEPESTKSAQTARTRIEIDADQIRSSIARLTTTSIDELEKLTSELSELQEFLKSETARVQREIGSALAGIGVIIETIAPWKAAASAQNNRAASGRDKLKRWPI